METLAFALATIGLAIVTALVIAIVTAIVFAPAWLLWWWGR